MKHATQVVFSAIAANKSQHSLVLWGLVCVLMVGASGLAYAEETEIYLVVNPYADVDWDSVSHHKLNLHTHTTESDGRMSPSEVIDAYHERGYDGLAITDHNICTWPWTDFDRDPDALGMLAIPGNELSHHHHALSLFTGYETDSRDIGDALRGVGDSGGMAILCHPAMHWVRDYAAPGLQVALTPPMRALTQGDFTVETWFRTTDAERNILLGNYSGDYEGALNLELHTDNRVRVFLQPHGDGRTVSINVSADALDIDTRDGQWHHLAGIRRDDTVYLYLDGQLIETRDDAAGHFDLQGDTFYIGRDSRPRNTPLDGDLFRARLWRRALDAEEVAALVTGQPVAKNGLLAEYAASDTLGAESAGHADGPFPAVLAGAAPVVIEELPPVYADADEAFNVLQFLTDGFPEFVPEATVARYATLFQRHAVLKGMEVHNRTRPDREYPLDRELWDRLLAELMPERPVWGVATDDMHRIQQLGGDWVVIPAPELDMATARMALSTGRYFFASTRLHEPDAADVDGTPRIERVAHDSGAGRLEVTATVAGETLDDAAYVWIADGVEVQTGPTLYYRDIEGLNAYVRLEITGDGGTTYTNPFGFSSQPTLFQCRGDGDTVHDVHLSRRPAQNTCSGAIFTGSRRNLMKYPG